MQLGKDTVEAFTASNQKELTKVLELINTVFKPFPFCQDFSIFAQFERKEESRAKRQRQGVGEMEY